jgi:ankyrin repeat protein
MGPAMLVSEHELPDEIPLDERCLPCFIRNEATESLLRQGYQCLSDITYGYTPPKGVLYDVMRASATTGDLVLLRRLLLITNSDANLKRVAANLLHDACKEGNKYLVAMLLEVGVNVNAVRSFGYSTHSFAPHRAFNALQFAVHVGRNNLIDVLINRGATIFTGEQHLDFDFLSQVIAQDTVNFVKPLLAKAATSDTNTAHKGVPVLIFVVNQSYDKMINLLTETGFNPFSCLYEKRLPTGEIHFQSAFGNALRTGKVRYLEKFLKFPHRGLDKERSQERLRQLTIAYFFACSSENLGLEKAILDTGWRPDDGNLVMEYDYMRKHLYGALAAAVKHGDCTKVDSLIQMGTSPNIPQDLDVTSFTSYTRTPLQWAMKGANVPIVRQLVAAGADVNVLSSWINKTPLQEAVSMRNLEMVSLLIEAGADVNARPRSYGQSAVETAAENGNLEMVTYLLESGADIQRPQNTNYRRTLYRAQRAGHNAVVDLLQEWKRYKYGEQDCDTIDNIKSSMTCEELCIPTESDRADG